MLGGASDESGGPLTMTVSCLYMSELGYSIPHQYVPASGGLTSEMVIWAPLEFGTFAIVKRGFLFGGFCQWWQRSNANRVGRRGLCIDTCHIWHNMRESVLIATFQVKRGK